MTRIFSIIAVAFVAISSVQAACGGGGYRVSTSKDSKDPRQTTVATTTTVQRTNSNLSETKRDDSSSGAQNVAYRSQARSWEKAHVDAARGRMDLTSNQDAVLEKVSSDFRKQGDDLKAAYDEAKKKLDACKGDCPDEKKKVAEASAALDKLDQDYERRISRFLSFGQLETFRSTAAASSYK